MGIIKSNSKRSKMAAGIVLVALLAVIGLYIFTHFRI